MGGNGMATLNWGDATCSYTATAANWKVSTTSSYDWLDDCTASTAPQFTYMRPMTYKFTADLIDAARLAASPDVIPAGARTLTLPDGAKLIVDDAGNYRIEDQDAKVTYKANRVREFSPHLNASDMLANFVRYVRSLGVEQKDVLGLPLELFINWLVIEAAERDSDPVPADVTPVPAHPMLKAIRKPRCLACGRFIPRLYLQHRFAFCGPEHGAVYLRRAAGPRLIPCNA